MCMFVCMYTYIYECIYVHIHMPIRIYAYIYTCMFVCKGVYIYIWMYICTHTYAYTHIHVHASCLAKRCLPCSLFSMPVPLGVLRANVELPQQQTRGKTSTPSKVGQPRGLAGSAGKENRHAHTPATPASSATPGSVRRRMLKEDLVELLSTARLSDLQAELKAISPARSNIHVLLVTTCPHSSLACQSLSVFPTN